MLPTPSSLSCKLISGLLTAVQAPIVIDVSNVVQLHAQLRAKVVLARHAWRSRTARLRNRSLTAGTLSEAAATRRTSLVEAVRCG